MITPFSAEHPFYFWTENKLISLCIMGWWLKMSWPKSVSLGKERLWISYLNWTLSIIIEKIKAHHCLNGVESIWIMAFFTRVFVLTSSLLLALYTTSRSLDFLEIPEIKPCINYSESILLDSISYSYICNGYHMGHSTMKLALNYER